MPDSASPSTPLDVVLHIGTGKTGTSSIQAFLHRNRDRLAELGYLYPRTPGGTRHIRLGLSVQPDDALDGFINWHRQGASSPEAFRTSFRRRLRQEIDESGLSRVVFSDEALYASRKEALRHLREFIDRIAGSLRLIVYLRRQDDHLVSRYQQVVKVGETKRLAEWARDVDLSGTYDYHLRLRTWERLLEPEEFVVRRYEPDSFAAGSLYQDFLDAAGIDARAAEWHQGPNRNRSLDAESVEFLRQFNVYRVEKEKATPGLIDNRALAARLAEVSDGPVLSLPAGRLDEFMAQWAEGNELVARRFLRDPDGQLFRMPRRTRNVTTEQRLRPDRLDRYLTLLELPDRVRAALRERVEREADDRVARPTG